jgi:hypothetical protein
MPARTPSPAVAAVLLELLLLLQPPLSVLVNGQPSASMLTLDGLQMDWWVASKLALPVTPGRAAQVECVRSQIDCSSSTEYVLNVSTNVHGMGSCLLTDVAYFLVEASNARSSALALMNGWQYGHICSNDQLPPFECFFEPVCPAAGLVHKNNNPQVIPATWNKKDFWEKTEALEKLCDATYEEVAVGIMQHVRLLDPLAGVKGGRKLRHHHHAADTAAPAAPAAPAVPSASATPAQSLPTPAPAPWAPSTKNGTIKCVFSSSTPPTDDYVALHVRVKKDPHEYTDRRDRWAVKSANFWDELLRQLNHAGHKHVYIAADDCDFAQTFSLQPGQKCYSTCSGNKVVTTTNNTAALQHVGTTADGHLADYLGLRIDLYRLRHAMHFYADLNRCASCSTYARGSAPPPPHH